MWRTIKQKITQINKATGVEIFILPDDSLQISTLTSSIKAGTLTKEDTHNGIKGFEHLASKIKKDTPLSIVFNGKGVLTKKLTGGLSTDNPLAAVLPGANPADFYYQLFQNEHFSAISVIRRETADKLLEQLKDHGFRVLSLSLGFFLLPVVLSYFKENTQEVETNGFTIRLSNENQVIDFDSKTGAVPDILHGQPEYMVAGQYVTAPQLISLAASVQLLADAIEVSEPVISTPLIHSQREEYRYYSIFKFTGVAFLAVLFISLLVSFLVYNHYFSLNKDLQSAQPFTQQQNQRIRKLETDIRKKEKFLQQSGWINTGKSSYYADRIAGLTPGDILLTSMNIYPAKSNLLSEQGSLQYKKDTIEVTGICSEPVELNQFVNGLKVLPDFGKVTIRNYQYRKESEAGTFLMEIITR